MLALNCKNSFIKFRACSCFGLGSSFVVLNSAQPSNPKHRRTASESVDENSGIEIQPRRTGRDESSDKAVVGAVNLLAGLRIAAGAVSGQAGRWGLLEFMVRRLSELHAGPESAGAAPGAGASGAASRFAADFIAQFGFQRLMRASGLRSGLCAGRKKSSISSGRCSAQLADKLGMVNSRSACKYAAAFPGA